LSSEPLGSARCGRAVRRSSTTEVGGGEPARSAWRRLRRVRGSRRRARTCGGHPLGASSRAFRVRADAELRERQRAETAKLQAERAQQEAIEQQQRLAAQADQARQDALRSQQEQAELRHQLLIQLNQVLETRETARGLIVNMSDVLFDSGQYTLKPGAREKLAKVSGIILAHPGLRIDVEGHTDSIGSDEYNLKLSENRASSVRSYLVSQGVNSGVVTAKGYGKAKPVANNSTAAGRQQNRRVEMVVSGEMLGSSFTLGASR